MPTKLSHFAEGLMEAAWLAAVILTPLFFNIYSSRIFEPEKIALLRSLALVILSCWMIIWIETGSNSVGQLKSWLTNMKSWFRQPLFLQVFALGLVTIISTIFSVTPAISLRGSYPRLQGAYTTFSYLVIFASMLVFLKRRDQVQRLIGVIIITSLPVSLYGILQRYGLDPIPWGGDVSQRIASNLGNSIFVAAYLIMVFPLTVMRIVEAFEGLLNDERYQAANFARSTGYIFIAALQVIAIYFSGSRGPWLGWATSVIVIWLGLSLIWRKRWLTIAGVTLAVLAGGFIITLNIPSGPLENLRTRPEFGRLGQLLDAESRTGKVRSLIWQGSAELVSPHEPLEYPDGRQDSWNAIRPLIGYGPEAMYVAYNRYYPPELALVEKRNASPDRAHNETWDSLITTGLAGLIVYLTLFGSVIYFGLKWLGFIRTRNQKHIFLGMSIVGGALSTAVFLVWQGVSFFGVALPFGMLLGVVGYLLISSVAGWFEPVTTPTARMRAYLLLGLIAAILAHFAEINFGIAIAVTRTYFWVYVALVLLIGYRLSKDWVFQVDQLSTDPQSVWGAQRKDEAQEDAKDQENLKPTASRQEISRKKVTGNISGRKKQLENQGKLKNQSLWFINHGILQVALVLALLLMTLGFNYLTNNQRSSSVFAVIWESLTSVKDMPRASFGILALVMTTWLVGGAVLSAEHCLGETKANQHNFLVVWSGVLTVSFISAAIFWLIQAGNLVELAGTSALNLDDVLEQVRMSENFLTDFYALLLVLMLILGGLKVFGESNDLKMARILSGAPAIVIWLAVLALASYSNLRIVQADVAFKTAELFAQPKSWPVAIAIYQRANELAPKEDYYYLFLGRAYLEHAKSIPDPNQNQALITMAARDLKKAQALNPLNTDHSANLARLYSMWASTTDQSDKKLEYARASEAYFEQALNLSPMNARLWNEWAAFYLTILDQPDQAYECIQKALELDSSYDWTYALLGDYYNRMAYEHTSDELAMRQSLENASRAYQTALLKVQPENTQYQFSYALALGSIQSQLQHWDAADQSFRLALNLAQNGEQWRVYEALSLLSFRKGQKDLAQLYANQALEIAPEEVEGRLRQWLDDISHE